MWAKIPKHDAELVLRRIVDLPLTECWIALDLTGFSFGNEVPKIVELGPRARQPALIAMFSLHVQCNWIFSSVSPQVAKLATWKSEEVRHSRLALTSIRKFLSESPLRVRSITIGNSSSLDVSLEQGFQLTTLEKHTDSEIWRLICRDTSKHLVAYRDWYEISRE